MSSISPNSSIMAERPIFDFPLILEANIPERPKKRFKKPQEWARNKSKQARLQGRELLDAHGNVTVVAKRMRDVECECKCSGKFTDDEKEYIYEEFRSKKTHSMQNEYLRGCTIVKGVNLFEGGKYRRLFQHFLRFDTKTVNVCQKYFLGIHGIKRSRLRTKILRQEIDVDDRRGKHSNHRIVTDEDTKFKMRVFFSSLHTRPSHYSLRANPHRKFMDSYWTIAALYREFFAYFPETRGNATLTVFTHIFNTEYNIKFGDPRKDKCATCERLLVELKNAKTVDSENLDLIQEKTDLIVQHLQAAEIFYNDYAAAKNFPDDQCAICFDYEKNLPLPSTNINKEYYISQLWVQNFGIKNLQTGETKLFVYSEHFACKGVNEVLSLLLWYIDQFVRPNVRILHLFCDNPVGQNKNRFMFAALHYLATTRFERVYIKYPVPGHSRMPIDGDFGTIQKVLDRYDNICYPSHILNFIANARPENPFPVFYVNNNFTDDLCDDGTPVVDVKDFKLSLAPLFPSLNAAALHLQQIREILFVRNIKPLVNFTERFVNPRRELLLFRQISDEIIVDKFVNAPTAYDDFIPIMSTKLRNVAELLKHVESKPGSIFYDTLYANEGNLRRYLNA